MDARRKHAYRWLLYMAMLDIRRLRWDGDGWRQRFNPFRWRGRARRVRAAGGIADWLHNLAVFSALDFAQFDENWFWQEFERLLARYPDAGLKRYQTEFERLASPAEMTDAEPEPYDANNND